MSGKTSSLAQQRAARARTLGVLLMAGVAGLVLAVRWLVRRTWRRAFPLYWVAAALSVAWLSGPLGVPAGTVGLAALITLAVAGGWPARSWPVRGWRAVIVLVLGGAAVATTAAGGPAAMAAHPTLTVFAPAVAGVLLGWPWWHHLRQPTPVAEPDPAPVAVPAGTPDPLTELWAGRWAAEVTGVGVCADTRVVRAVEPRSGVTELLLQLIPGRGVTSAAIVKKGPEVEVCLDLDDGSVGFASTGKASRVRCSLTHQSYVAAGVAWTGPVYRDGRAHILTYVDGSPGWWTANPAGFGVKNGLVVGSSGSGKSRALGVLIASYLDAGWMVVVGDSQYGQSLPAWQDKVEYHSGPQDVTVLIRRLHAEVKRRSELLGSVRVDVFDEDDPRVQKLGLKRLAAFIDECQLVLIRGSKIVDLAQEIAETSRKTGVGLYFATQLPQLGSLGGSQRLRDALVGGNCLVLRVSNRGSGPSILPDDFVGDPFGIKPEDEQGRPTAGMGYLRTTFKVGMIGRVPKLDEAAAAAAAPAVDVVWQVPAIDPDTPIDGRPGKPATTTSSGHRGENSVSKLAAMFSAIGRKPHPAPAAAAAAPTSSPDWVLGCLRKGPTSAQALLDRPDCPVKSAQLYALLSTLAKAGAITPPATSGGPYTIADRYATATAQR